MKFREWIKVDEINKGLTRHFRQQQPHLPRYVQNQVLQNRVAPLWRNTMASQNPTISSYMGDGNTPENQKLKALKAQQPTMAHHAVPEADPNRRTYSNPKDIYQDDAVQSIAGSPNWKQEAISVSPLDFTQETIQSFLRHEFGSSPSLSKHVRNHDQRMQVQSGLAQSRGEGENEPIIMIRRGDKYEMQEGWHRLYSYLMRYSAPPEERAKIEGGHIDQIDLSQWKPIRINAYVGS